MINAILNSKIDINRNEDALTSTVFGHLSLLPNKILWKIIGNEEIQNIVNLNEDSQTTFEFWPHWNPDGTGNTNYVEPDVFIQTEKFNVIVEAKRGDDSGQYLAQWQNEIKAYKNEEYEMDKKVYFLAVGGVPNEQQEQLEKVTILKLSWNSLLTNAQQALKSIDDSNNICSKILERLLVGMSIFGYYEHRWFNVWEQSYKLSNYDLAIKQLNPPKTDLMLQKTDLMLQYKISDKSLSILA